MRKRLVVLLITLTGVALAGCVTPPRLTQPEKERAVFSWLDCDECYNGQFEYVISLGPQVRETLENAAVHREPFGSNLDARRGRYATRSNPIAAAQLGIDLTRATSEDQARVDARAEELADFYVRGDKNRHKRRAAKALENLSRRNPSPIEGRDP